MPATASYPQLRARSAPALPVARMVVGKPVAEAADLLPRLFNLCREAQAIAARAAFGLPPRSGWQEALRREILREHIVRLCLKWPALLNTPAVPLPRSWQEGDEATRAALFGRHGGMPRSAAALHAFLSEGEGVAPVLGAIALLFAPGEACRPARPGVTGESLWTPGTCENSVAGRQAHHPALRAIETAWGRGPLWSAAAVACEIEALWDEDLPPATLTPGRACVPAARGLYGIAATVDGGRVAAFARITPTDHLLAPDGALERTLANLAGARARALAPVLLAVLDPCHPVTLEPMSAERETADA